MYIISELTGKIYLNGLEIPLDDSKQEFQQYLIDKDIVGFELIEATPEEIAEQQQAEALEQAKQFLANNKTAGEDYYNNINLRVTVALFAVEKNVLFPILQEIEAILYPPLNKIKTGDFASALFIFSNQTPPTDAFVLSFYNEALDFCQNYYDTNYPK